jgi:putative peptide zinc metalloprotease protein
MPSGPPAAGVFPFDLPLPPADGDNQALAVNTTDDTVAYDVAFALVWVDDDTVTNTNEAFAAASCTGCAAVAVSFQVVFVMSDADVIVPQNLATAVNYDCLECLTYALASQLVITLDGPLGDSSLQALESLWQQMSSFAADITSVPLDELDDELNAFQQQIEEIILADPSASPGRAGSTGPSPGQSTSPSGEPSGPATDQPSQDPTPTPSSTTSSPPTPSVSDTPTETSSGSVTPTPTPSQSPSPSASPSSTALVTQASPVLWSGG